MTTYNENQKRASGILLFLTLLLVAFAGRADSSISGPNPICTGVSGTFSVQSTLAAVGYAWNISSNTPTAEIIGATNGVSVVVVATNGSVFALECVVDLGGTNELASTNITVTPAPPAIVCPTNIAVNCLAEVPPAD